LVRDGQAVGRGFHTWAGVKHGEILALEEAGERARGATLYINLEPCCHEGRTGPCTAARVIPDAPHEVLLVLDATTGQNGLEQARKFTETSGVTGIVLAKLDGTAKGGIVIAIARELNIPIRYVGIGEKADDLLPFDAEKFIASLFEK
jgi:hypothetical protein